MYSYSPWRQAHLTSPHEVEVPMIAHPHMKALYTFRLLCWDVANLYLHIMWAHPASCMPRPSPQHDSSEANCFIFQHT